MQAIGQCTGLAPDNIYLETNTNTSFPIHNDTPGAPAGIDVGGDGNVIGSGGGGESTSAGFNIAIPILSSLTFGAFAALSIIL